jgi:putative flippase GtrA
MIDRILRALVFGFVGAIVGYCLTVFVVNGIHSLQYGNDPSIGMVTGGIAIAIGFPLGFTIGAIFGFRERKQNEL